MNYEAPGHFGKLFFGSAQPVGDGTALVTRASRVQVWECTNKGKERGGGQEKRKDRKTRKSRSEVKVMSLSSAFLFPARKREAVTQVGTRG